LEGQKQNKKMKPTMESRLDRQRHERSNRLETMAETALLAIQRQQRIQANQAGLQSTQTEMRQSIENVMQMIVTLAKSADEDRKLANSRSFAESAVSLLIGANNQ
jgi:hypothetical protein